MHLLEFLRKLCITELSSVQKKKKKVLCTVIIKKYNPRLILVAEMNPSNAVKPLIKYL